MKNKLYKSLVLGISTVIAASTSYALIVPEKTVEPTVNSAALPLPATQAKASSLTINTPSVSLPQQTEIEEITPAFFNTITHTIEKGESLSTIFANLNLSKKDLHRITHTNKLGKQLVSIRPGKDLIVNTDYDGLLQQLIYKKNAIETLEATRNGDNFDIEIVSKPIERKTFSAQATINSSLFLDGKDAGLSDKTIMQLANIFAWDIDFALSLHKGDQFTVVYEKLFVDDQEIGTGNIVSAEFISQNNAYTTVRFEDDTGNASYYTPEGKSMRKAFLRTPVDFARISSRFNLKRKHPVLNRIRAHKGVDYAARTGTKIKTTGDGKVVFRGRKGGYGRVVIVQHGQRYSSLYAHMSKFRKGQKVGSRVKQGDIIGYVGKSGLATGAHLHYEFRVNGVHRNPLTVKLPHANPIEDSLLAEFKEQTQPLLTQLNQAKASNLLAQNLIK